MKLGSFEYKYLQQLIKMNPGLSVSQAIYRLNVMKEHIGLAKI